MARWRLMLLVFVSGACSLATEVTGARLLAPFFGASNVVWANVIGLILLYLSLGYWLGGRLADRFPTERALGMVVMVAAVAVGALPFVTSPLFGWAASAFARVSAADFVASFASTMVVFALPVTALGSVSPWAIRLAVSDVRSAGSVAGRLYAVSTLGSILGTFVPVLVAVPTIGTRRTLLVCAALLAAAALPMLPRRALVVPLLLAAAVALPPGLVKAARDGRVLYEGESPYQFVQVVRGADGSVMLHLNEGFAVHSILPARGLLTAGYWDAFLVLPLLSGAGAGRLAVLGNAAGTVAHLYGAAWPQTRIDGVELDPLVTDIGRRFFGMHNPRLVVHTADARYWLSQSAQRYDEIVVDAYRQPYIPFHLVSREFFALVRRHLTPGGVVAINVGTPPRLTAAVAWIARTMRAVFPAVEQSRYDTFNSVVIGYADAAGARRAPALLAAARGVVTAPAERLARTLTPVTGTGPILTDDHAPIELITDRAILAYLAQGAPGAKP